MTYKLIHDGVVRDVFVGDPKPGENYLICPYCAPHRKPEHQREKKLSINVDKFPKPWRCKHCDARGYVMEDDYVKSLPVKPVLNRQDGLSISDGLSKWFWEQRGIGIQTLRDFKISMSLDSLFLQRTMPGEEALHLTWQTRKCINFPYIMDGMLVNIKFRDEAKNFKMLKGADLIMHNIDSIKDSEVCIITEGEFEPMSYHEAGVKYVISVPNGSAVSPAEVEEYEKTGQININTMIDMTYLDNVMPKLKHIKTFILALDDDAAGFKLRELLARRLGKGRCKYIEFRSWKRPDGSACKDPNDVLVNHGKEQLAYSVNKAIPYPIKEVTTAKTFRDKLIFSYDNETPAGLPTGYKMLDPHWRWMPGYFYALNGWPASGKTTFMMNMAVVTAVMYGWRWGVYSPENYPIDQLVETIVEMYLGNTIQASYGSLKNPRAKKDDMLNAIDEFVEKHFHFIEDRIDGYTPKDMRAIKLRLWEYNGVNAFFTDPWKNLRHDDTMPLERYLNRELSQEVRFATGNQVTNIISSHPPTPERGKKSPDVPSPNMMYGGAIWFQSAYGMIAIQRTNPVGMTDTRVEIHIQKMKNQKLAGMPTQEPIIFDFRRRSNRYYESNGMDDKYDRHPLEDSNLKDINLFNQF